MDKGKTSLRVKFDNKPVPGDELSEYYIAYVQSLFAEKLLSKELEQTKSETEVEVKQLSKQLDLSVDILQKTEKRKEDISFWLKREKLAHGIEKNLDDVLETLEKTLPGHVAGIINALEVVNNKLPTKNIETPQSFTGRAEFDNVLEETLAVLEDIQNTTEERVKNYAQVAKLVDSIYNSKERINDSQNQCDRLLPCVNSNLLLKSIIVKQEE